MTSPDLIIPDCCAHPPLIVLARHRPSAFEALYVKPNATLAEEDDDDEMLELLTSLAATLATLPIDSLEPCCREGAPLVKSTISFCRLFFLSTSTFAVEPGGPIIAFVSALVSSVPMGPTPSILTTISPGQMVELTAAPSSLILLTGRPPDSLSSFKKVRPMPTCFTPSMCIVGLVEDEMLAILASELNEPTECVEVSDIEDGAALLFRRTLSRCPSFLRISRCATDPISPIMTLASCALSRAPNSTPSMLRTMSPDLMLEPAAAPSSLTLLTGKPPDSLSSIKKVRPMPTNFALLVDGGSGEKIDDEVLTSDEMLPIESEEFSDMVVAAPGRLRSSLTVFCCPVPFLRIINVATEASSPIMSLP
mmetsp:Transcript_6786/g.10756  ORF Transcript_6786/g.10756 Transcript_6786/m.10756 type:complete len:365 (-) Transcript_6786:2237-3331(-)